MNGRGGGRGSSKALFQLFVWLGFIWFLWIGVLEIGTVTLNSEVAAGSRKHMELVGKRHDQLNAHKHLEINFVNKRRVPNGPDPIHNRRAGNSHRPPGRA